MFANLFAVVVLMGYYFPIYEQTLYNMIIDEAELALIKER